MADFVLPQVADPGAPVAPTLTPEEQAEYLELREFYASHMAKFGVEAAERLFREDPTLGQRWDDLTRKSKGSDQFTFGGGSAPQGVGLEDNPQLKERVLSQLRQGADERAAAAASRDSAVMAAATGEAQRPGFGTQDLTLEIPEGSAEILPPPAPAQPMMVVEEPVAVVEEDPERLALRQLARDRQALEEERRQALREREARELADQERNRKAALLMMQAAAQPLGPSTIGEAISGKYGQAQAQAAQDINLVRQFFGERGKSSRALLKERQLKGKEDRFTRKEARLRQQARSKSETRERIEGAKLQVRREEGRLNRDLRAAAIDKRYEVGLGRMQQYGIAARAKATLGQDWFDFKTDLQNTAKNRDFLSNQSNEMRRVADMELDNVKLMERKVGELRKAIREEEGFAKQTYTDNSEVVGALKIQLFQADQVLKKSREDYTLYKNAAADFAKTRSDISLKAPPPSGRTSTTTTKKTTKRRRRRRRRIKRR